MEMLKGYSTEEKPIQKAKKIEDVEIQTPEKQPSELKKFVMDHPEMTVEEIAKLKKRALSTVKKYRSQIRNDSSSLVSQLTVISSGGE